MYKYIFLLLSVFQAVNLYAQDFKNDTINLDEIQVNAIALQNQYLKSTGAFQVVNLKKFKAQHISNSEEVINTLSGVFMSSGTNSTNRIVIRGVGSRTPYSTNRIRAYLDGIPLTSGDGFSTIEDIDLSDLSSIEVLKGPSSALYGAGLGGVLILNTAYPESNSLSIQQANTFGSFSSFRNNTKISYKKGRKSITASYNRTTSNGFRENNEFKRNNISLNYRSFEKKRSFIFNLKYIDLFGMIPSSLNYTDFTESPWMAAGNWNAINGYEEYQKLLSGLTVKRKLNNKFRNELTIYGKFSTPYERRPFNVLSDKSLTFGFNERIEYRNDILKIQGGIEHLEEYHNWKTFETLETGHGDMLGYNTSWISASNIFIFNQIIPTEKLIVDLGLNLNLTNYHLLENNENYRYKPVISPRLGFNYKFKQRNYGYFSVGHGFSTPSFEETLLPDGEINTALKPEYGWNFELGSRGSSNSQILEYDVTLYAVYLKNLLITERLTEDQFMGKNAGKVLNSGLEISSNTNLAKALNRENLSMDLALGMSLSSNRFLEFIDNGVDYSGNELPGIPSITAHAGLNTQIRSFNFRISNRFSGKQWLDDLNSLEYESFIISNMLLSWTKNFKQSNSRIEFSLAAKNIFNVEYASMILVNAPSFGGASPRYYYPGLPRNFQAGFNFKWN